jgi:hypothetical protein
VSVEDPVSRRNPSDAAALPDLRDALPGIVGVAGLFFADMLVDGWTLAIVDICVVVAALGIVWLRDRTSRGAERREARRWWEATMDSTERAALRAARSLPFVAGLVASGLLKHGFDVRIFAAALVVGFVIAQVVFALWLTRRRSGRAVDS